MNHTPVPRRHSWQSLQRRLADDIRPVAQPPAAASWLARARNRAQFMVAALSPHRR